MHKMKRIFLIGYEIDAIKTKIKKSIIRQAV